MHPEEDGIFNPNKPNAARIDDYYLGGFHFFDADKQFAEQMLAIWPEARPATWANRAFLRRVVAFLQQQGIDQFLDIGSGLPTAGNVQTLAQGTNPTARVVNVDNDPVAVAMSRGILKTNPYATAIQANVLCPETILNNAEVRQLLDFDRPIGLMLVALLHYIVDDTTAYQIVHTLHTALAPGSYVVISHSTYENILPAVCCQIEQMYSRAISPMKLRSRAAITPFFAGLELVDPGLVYIPLWRPETARDYFLDQPERSSFLAGVGCKP